MPGLRKRTRPPLNRCRSKAGGDQYGQNLRSASYTPNSLNQYTSRTVPGGFDMVGVANKDATVRVDGNDAQYRRGEYWRQYVSVDNAGAPVWRSVSVTTTGGGSATGGVFVPKTAEVFVHDLDGNLTSDGRWTYVWDGENRLTQMTANTTVGPRYQINFEYDWKGRRIRKTVTNLATSTVVLDNKFLYNGWNLIAELNATNNNVIRSYVWGLDVSGSFQGAGGVGGLLMVKDAVNGTHFAAYDLNGNVMGLVNAANGTISAQYEYGPFGEVIRMTGPMAKLNPFRFSTKYQDDETDLLYYGYRYYNASTGRWMSKDPIEEIGFQTVSKKRTNRKQQNLYSFVFNKSISRIDALGLIMTDEGMGNQGEYGYPEPTNNQEDEIDYPWYVDAFGAACDVGSVVSICFDIATIPSGEGAAATICLQACKQSVKNRIKSKIACDMLYSRIHGVPKGTGACDKPQACHEIGRPMEWYLERAANALECSALRAAWLKKCACKGLKNAKWHGKDWQEHWSQVGIASANAANCLKMAKDAGWRGDVSKIP